MPALLDNFVYVVMDHTAGDPMREDVVWTYLTQQEIADELADLGTPVSTPTVQGLLDMFEFSKRKAQKTQSMGQFPDRNEQFEYIAELKRQYLESNDPIVSMDTKKKESLGNFFRQGRLYSTGVIETYDHDFTSSSSGIVIPHGLYDLKRNVGHITLGLSHDTSEFACDSFYSWWRRHGQRAYPNARSILLLCDCGGSNSYRHYIFKEDLLRLVNKIEIPIRVAHYPPYCSKYNPIEHRFFPHVTRACQGIVFHTIDIVERFIRRTSTSTGLSVTLNVLKKVYQKKRKATERFLDSIPIKFHHVLPQLNYIIEPCQY